MVRRVRNLPLLQERQHLGAEPHPMFAMRALRASRWSALVVVPSGQAVGRK